jgi:hypothetical protein
MKRIEAWLFPRSQSLNFLIVACLSGALSFLLIGRQIYLANWGMIDDHEIYYFLGPGLHLPPTEIWSTLLAKTEVGSLQGRFRPGYYALKLMETSLWGTNVHLWYFAHTIGFATFLSSIWWFMRRFVGIWLAGVLTVCISLLPLWAGVWSRLGTSEAYGAACIGIALFAAYFLFFSDTPRARNVSAIVFALATVTLIGLKETFVPLAGGSVAALLLAGMGKKISRSTVVILVLVMSAALGGIVAVVTRQVDASGADYYAKPIEFWPVLAIGAKGLLLAIRRTWWICAAPILFFALLRKGSPHPPADRIAATGMAIAVYGFLVAMYAVQCALYRSYFPLHSRYDFPAMLLVPSSLCVSACYIFYMTRGLLSERAADYAQLAAAVLLSLGAASGLGHPDNGKALAAAVQTNIETTNSFYDELQLALSAAKKAPDSPIILEAYGPGAYEPVFSLSIYLPALGARNRISVRLHPEEKSQGKLYDGLQQVLADLEKAGTGAFTPLRDSLGGPRQGCISIGINGVPDAACVGFQVKTL